MTDGSGLPPAGWYDDPAEQGKQRYWDGEAWTSEVRSSTPAGTGIGQARLSAGDIASSAFRAWFDSFVQVFAVSFLFTVPIFIVNAAILTGLPDRAQDLDEVDLGNVVVRTLGGSILAAVLSVLLTAALTYSFIRIFRGQQVVPGDAARAVFTDIVPLLIFAVLSSILIAIGFVLFIIPGIMATIAFSLGVPAILNERLTGTSAISRAWRLISGNWGVAIGVVLIGLIVSFVVSVIVGGIAMPGGLFQPDFSDFSLLRALVQIGASAVVAPLIPALATALYFELKGRSEGFPSI